MSIILNGANDTPDDRAVKDAALATFAAAARGLSTSDWRDLVGMSEEEARKGAGVRGVHFGRDRRSEIPDPSKPIEMRFLTFGHADGGTHVFHGVVEDGRFTFREPDYAMPVAGSPLDRANARLSSQEVTREHVDMVAGARRGDEPVSLASGLVAEPVRVLVTERELLGAMGRDPDVADRKVRSRPEVATGVASLLHAVAQPVFDTAHNRTGEVRHGADGAGELLRGFGPGSVRGLWIDPAKAVAVAGGADLLATLAVETAGRDRRRAPAEASREVGRDEAGR